MARSIQERYPELLHFREEGMAKVGARFVDQIERPRSRCFFPMVLPRGRATSLPSVQVGPLRVSAVGGSMILAADAVSGAGPLRVLDIGCAGGRFRDYLRLRYPDRAIQYVGVDVAPPDVDFPVYRSISEIDESGFDLVLMSEVAEHMPADVFLYEYLAKVAPLLASDGTMVVGVPNPLAPTILDRDVTHIQHYPWFDLYALIRFFFKEAHVVRTRFIHTPRRLLSLPFRILISYLLEFDWCEGLTVVAKMPQPPPIDDK